MATNGILFFIWLRKSLLYTYVSVYTCVSHLLYPFVFHVLAIVNSAVMHIGVRGSFLFRHMDICPGVGLLDHMTTLFLVF